MTKPIDTSRREFLRNASLLSFAGSISTPFALNLFAISEAVAAPVYTDYKALVCLYLAGGNDSANMILATEAASKAGYMAARGVAGRSIALNFDNLLTITPTPTADITGRTFGLHPSMGGLQRLFIAGRAAFVANVGTLIKPTTKADFNDPLKPKPFSLFSHSDQTTQWLSADALKPNYGWGGRMADLLQDSNTLKNFSNISLTGNNVFLAGETVNQYQINSNGNAQAINGLTYLYGTNSKVLEGIVTKPTGSNVFEVDYTAVVNRSIAAQSVLDAVMKDPVTAVTAPAQYTTINNYPSDNPLANQLRTVARIIAGRGALGAHRQIFFVNVGGFDTHGDELNSHGDLMARLAHAVEYFDGALQSLAGTDMRNNVTLFTASDFGRTFASNGSGTDHGWGGHHFVVGGAVKGGAIYGSFPPTCVNSTDHPNELDIGSGTLIPTTSVDQYAATLASWFGVASTDIGPLFPNLGSFSPTNLSFMA
jgi:uncharacterized protein (DUF1501 family)